MNYFVILVNQQFREFMRIIILSFVFLMLTGFIQGQNQDSTFIQLKKHVYTLASDSLQGRGTGSVGQKKAAKYIADCFYEYGLSTKDSSYYLPFSLMKHHKDQAVIKQDEKMFFSPWHYFYASNYNHKDTIADSLLFVGYASLNELKPLSVNNKSILLLANDPVSAYERIKYIKKCYGSRLFLVVFDQEVAAVETVWRTSYESHNLNLKLDFEQQENLKIKESWATLEDADSLNVMYCFKNVLVKLYGKTDAQLFAYANDSRESLNDFPILPLEAYLNYNDSVEIIETENVSAFIKGKDTTQTIVLSAHFDHLGIKKEKIYYGADDNASGTAALIEVARLLSKKEKPPVNIQFIAFSAEELGLFGSQHYVRTPWFPLQKTMLNVNMDMIGRWDSKHNNKRDFVYLLCEGENKKKWEKLGKRVASKNKVLHVSFNPGLAEKMTFSKGSDHFSFSEKGVPIAVFFTGMHDDYHQPSDTPDKINYNNLSSIAKLVAKYLYIGGESHL